MVLKEFSLEGKVGIITGGGRGIGRAIALCLAEAGADVVVAARSIDEIEGTAKGVRELGRKAFAVPTDVTRPDDVRHLVERAVKEFGKMDILVNNAGMAIPKGLVPLPLWKGRPLPDLPGFDRPIDEDEFQRLMDTNLRSAFLCTREVGPYLIERRYGKVINISSINAVVAEPYQSLYCTSKAALSMFTRVMAREWARYNICVNAIGPGRFRTVLSAKQHDDPELRQRMLGEIPMRRTGELRDVGLLAVYLASPASDYMTGQTIFLDGGITA